ncbi:hypothetical protein Pelo_17759 [Pelomyxa schiedti]|nr:hypothetical protein Pelo_17759 [Pelomyxa schiedti]
MDERVLRQVLLWLRDWDLVNASCVSHQWRRIAKSVGPCCPPCVAVYSHADYFGVGDGGVLDLRGYIDRGKPGSVVVTENVRYGHVCCCCSGPAPGKEFFVVQHAPLSRVTTAMEQAQGGILSRITRSISSREPLKFRVLSYGSDIGGTLMYHLKDFRIISEEDEMYHCARIPWDLCGQKVIFSIWGADQSDDWVPLLPCDAVIYLSNNYTTPSSVDLHHFVNSVSPTKLVPVLVLASDQQYASLNRTTHEVAAALDMHGIKCTAWRVQGYTQQRGRDQITSPTLAKGLSWLARQLFLAAMDPHWPTSNINHNTSTVPTRL